jgi:hypothetical protein
MRLEWFLFPLHEALALPAGQAMKDSFLEFGTPNHVEGFSFVTPPQNQAWTNQLSNHVQNPDRTICWHHRRAITVGDRSSR